MPPPGIPDWVFPGAVVQQGGVGPRFTIGVMELHDDLHHLEIYLYEVIEGPPPRLRAAHSEEPGMYLGDLLLNWRPTGEYLYPPGQQATTTITGHHPIGALISVTGGRGEAIQYRVLSNRSDNVTGLTSELVEVDLLAAPTANNALAMEPAPMPGQYYRWETQEPPSIMTIRINRIVGDDVEVSFLTAPDVVRIPMVDFIRASAHGRDDKPHDGPFAQRLAFNRTFLGPESADLREGPPVRGDIRLDHEAREVVLVERQFNGTWVCLAAHDLSQCPNNYLGMTSFYAHQPGTDGHQDVAPVDDEGRSGFDLDGMDIDLDQMSLGQAAIFRNLMEDQATIVPMDSTGGSMSLARMAASMFGDLRREDAEDQHQRMMNPLTRVPLTGFVPMGLNMDETRAITEMRIGDRWRFEAPNEGMWTLETIRNVYDGGRGEDEDPEHTDYMFRGDDGAVMQGPSSWVVRNGHRISPPDPRYTGDPIEVNQIWEIPTNSTRQLVTRWRVTSVGFQASTHVITLMPENGEGAPLYWPEIMLRRQGRYVADGRIRRTAFERVLAEDDDGG